MAGFNVTGHDVSEDSARLPTPLELHAEDGQRIGGFVWRHNTIDRTRAVVIINPATSVRCRYYARFAGFLFESGLDVISYDYRGIGESRPASMRGFDAGWLDWGCQDFEAVLQYAQRSFGGQPIDAVAHSVGGFVIGLAASGHLIRRIVTLGAQYAYWRDYAPDKKLGLLAKWHLAMPLLTLLFGYFPGKRLGWLEDTPKGVVRDWVLSRRRFEDTWRGRAASRYPDKQVLLQRFAAVTAPMLAISTTDDEFATVRAVERLLGYFRGSRKLHLRIAPTSISEPGIGHFAFFHGGLKDKLWGIPLEWLLRGQLPASYPGQLHAEATHAVPEAEGAASSRHICSSG
jgi:predicted alpha/beta hydrolase